MKSLPLDDYTRRQLLEAMTLRLEADADDRAAAEAAESNPTYSDYLSRRATHKRRLANDADGGLGQ